MIVSVFSQGKEQNWELVIASDLVFVGTDERNVEGKKLYRVTKDRYGKFEDRLVTSEKIRHVVADYED
jgi:hypothetical protein